MNIYVKAVRLPFLTGSLMPVFLATAQAYARGFFAGVELVLILAGVGLLQLAANVINDYFDARGSDPLNVRITPFSGGSRVIQERKLTSRQVLLLSLFLFGLAILAGLGLILLGHTQVAWIGLLGLAAALLYSADPVRFMSRGLGEISIFLAFGPLITLGTDYVMTNELTGQAFLLGFPLGFLIAAVIWINLFPDYQADREAGKRNLVVRLGLPASRWIYLCLMSLPFLFLFYLIFGQGMSPFILLAWLAFPLALKGMRIFWGRYAEFEHLVPAQALTIQTHLTLGLLMTIGVLVGHFVGK
jgi:1,4-dihydroxy-2-naphthoate octaprenyltransferase